MSQEKKSRLGRGLDALLGGTEEANPGSGGVASGGARTEVPLATIEKNPHQPRKTFDEDDLASLCESIKTHGVIQPLVVRQVGERFELIAGERRLRAAEAAGLSAVPITVVNFNDQQCFEAALIENIQRADLNPIEKAQGFKDYLARFHMTHEQLGARLGVGRATITNLVSLLDLPGAVQEMIRIGQLTVGHAKALKGLSDPERQVAVAREIFARGLSVHATEAHIKQLLSEEKEPAAEEPTSGGGKGGAEKTAHVISIEDELRKKLGLKVEIRVKAKERGQMILSFETNDDFERMVEVLRA